MRWIFGYGSLIWRPDFSFLEQQPASIRGWRRRFWQASPDHRGVPEAPGRVVTLVREPGVICHGMAYRPAADDLAAIVAALDVREQNGYELLDTELELTDGRTVTGMTYIAGPHNPSFTGPQTLAELVSVVSGAHGPSGSNREYVVRLAAALSDLGVQDDEVHGLRDALRAHDRRQPETCK